MNSQYVDEYVSEGKRKYVLIFPYNFITLVRPCSRILWRGDCLLHQGCRHRYSFSPFLIPLAEEAEEAADSAAISDVPPSEELRTLKEAEESLYKAEHLITEHDLQIVALDLPERMQLIDSTPLSPSRLTRRLPRAGRIGGEAGVQPVGPRRAAEAPRGAAGLRQAEAGAGPDRAGTAAVQRGAPGARVHHEVRVAPPRSAHRRGHLGGLRRLPPLPRSPRTLSRGIHAQDDAAEARAQLEALRGELRARELTDGLESLEHLVEKLLADLRIPGKRQVESIRVFAGFLRAYLAGEDESRGKQTSPAMTRLRRRLTHAQDPAVLDLAAQFTLGLDHVEANLIARSMTAEPPIPDQVSTFPRCEVGPRGAGGGLRGAPSGLRVLHVVAPRLGAALRRGGSVREFPGAGSRGGIVRVRRALRRGHAAVGPHPAGIGRAGRGVARVRAAPAAREAAGAAVGGGVPGAGGGQAGGAAGVPHRPARRRGRAPHPARAADRFRGAGPI